MTAFEEGSAAPAPLVSVLLPARDAASTLPSCLGSLRRQSLERWECLLIDDGSRDETAAVAARHAAEDARIRLIRTPARGIVEALGVGLEHCRGSFVARMDADDVMHRDRLRLQAAALDSDPSLSGVGCHVRIFPRRALTEGRRAYERWLNSLASPEDVARDAYVECPVAHPTLMLRRDVATRLGYRDAGWAEDYDLVLRLLGEGRRLGMVPRRLLAWRDGARRLSRVDPRYGLDRFAACKADFLARGFLADRPSYVLWGFGETGKLLSRALAHCGRRPSHIVEVHPRRIGRRIAGAPVVGLDALAALRGERIVVSVAGTGPRGEIRGQLDGLGFVELRDYVCAA